MDESGGSGQPRSGDGSAGDPRGSAPRPHAEDHPATGAHPAPDEPGTDPVAPESDGPEAGDPGERTAEPVGPAEGKRPEPDESVSDAPEPDAPDSGQPDPDGSERRQPGAGKPQLNEREQGEREEPASPAGAAERPEDAAADPAPDAPDPDPAGSTPDPDDPDPDPADRPSHPRQKQPPAGRTPAHTPGGGPQPDGGKGGGKQDGKSAPGGGILMGRPFGVPVYVAPSWFLVAALITWVFGGQLERVLPHLGAARYLVALFFAVAFYASVLVHELAHTVVALRYKLPVRRIQLQFFGGVSEIEKESESPGREFLLAFVGPLLSLVLAAVFYGSMRAVERGSVPGVLLAGLMISNLLVAAFNLLPGLPLDGGRMLRAVVWKITGRPMAGTVAAAWVGRALAVSVLIGLPLATSSDTFGGNQGGTSGFDTVTNALLAAILAAIIWTGAGNSLRMARLREHLPELRARTLTRRAVPVTADTPLSEALRRANASGARALVVVDPDGEPRALVREAGIVGVPEHRRPWVAVGSLAQDLTEGMRVSAELAGEELLDFLRTTPASEYLVVEESGEIYGVLSAADVERAFVKAMARPS
ncbi:site-2 protease family protein [Streptomyces sp. NPDC058045]|uniref:site-2 protease family protein n=1 Tax=Streptomyces sp. NPDC058045 TaxID=3346311 RepID=UPI0036E61A7F